MNIQITEEIRLPALPYLSADARARELEAGAETAREVARALIDWLRAYTTKVSEHSPIKPDTSFDDLDDMATKAFDIHNELKVIAERVGGDR